MNTCPSAARPSRAGSSACTVAYTPTGRCLLPAVAAALCLHAPTALHADDEAPTRVFEGEVSIGTGYLSDDAYFHGKYTGIRAEGLEPLLEFGLRSRPVWDSGETFHWRIDGTRLGQDARRLDAEVGEHGTQRLRLGYLEIPRFLSDDGVTPFRDTGSGFLTLPTDWTAEGSSTAGMAQLEASLRPAPIRERRRRLTVDWQRELPQDWRLTAAWRHDMKSGDRIVGAQFGTGGGNTRAALLPAPLDHRTDVIDLGLDRHSGDYSLGLAYSGSYFRNDTPSVSWQNPYSAHPQWPDGVGFPDGVGRISQEPDNSAHRVSVSGAYRFTPLTRLSGQLSHGRMRQNAALLDYTVNPRLDADAPLPRESLDARIDTTLATASLTTRPTQRAHLNVSYRYDDRNNRTPRETWRVLHGDAQHQPGEDGARLNRPYSHTEHRVTGRLNYRLTRGLRLHGGYEYTHTDRDYSEVTRVEEHGYSVGLRHSALSFAMFSVDLGHSRRDAGTYVGNRPLMDTRPPGTVGDDDFENHPLLRKYYLADRDRDRVQLRADFHPGATVNLGAAFAYNRDDYRNSVFGLNRADMRSLSLDAGWTPMDELQLTAFVTVDRYSSEQTGRAFTAAPGQADDPDRNWWVDARDRFRTWGLSGELTDAGRHVEWLRLSRQLDLGAEITWSRSRGLIDVDSGPALDTEALPDLYSKLNHYRLHASYRLDDRSAVRAAWTHERYASRDFALDMTDPATVSNVIALGERSPNHSVNWVTLSYYRSF